MAEKEILIGKNILIVDDEPDVLDSLTELLDSCKIDTASTYAEAVSLMESRRYDITILDIMGVRGFELLEIANKQKIPALMLTAHALSEENLKKSASDGAAYFVPKDEMADIQVFVSDVLTALDTKKSTWEKWFDRLSGFYDKRFHGTGWREKEKEFWNKKIKEKF